MNLRQLLDTYRSRAARQQAETHGAPAGRFRADPHLPRSGWCAITDANDADDGKYEVTELWWDQTADGGKGAWAEAVSPPGLVETVAYEADRASTGEVDDQCLFWQTRTKAGVLQTHVLFPPVEEILWGKAKANWSHGINGPEVTVYPCPDITGGGADTGTEHIVYFPTGEIYEPNIRTDNVIGYVKSGQYYQGIYGARYQEIVGSVKVWHDAGNIPIGWQFADGTNGTRDLRGRFIVGYNSTDPEYNTVGKTGGSKTSQPADHAPHNHFITAATKKEGTGANFDALGSCWTDNAGPQSHSLQNNRPPYYVLIWIERVD